MLEAVVGWKRSMRTILEILFVSISCIAILGCSRTPQPRQMADTAKPAKEQSTTIRASVTETEAKQLASDHVNSTFKGHVWNTALGNRAFYSVSAQYWHSIETKDGRLVLKYGFGNRGQDFVVSMNLNGTGIKVEHDGYALQ